MCRLVLRCNLKRCPPGGGHTQRNKSRYDSTRFKIRIRVLLSGLPRNTFATINPLQRCKTKKPKTIILTNRTFCLIIISRDADGGMLMSIYKGIHLILPKITESWGPHRNCDPPVRPFMTTTVPQIKHTRSPKRDVFPGESGLLQFVVISIKE